MALLRPARLRRAAAGATWGAALLLTAALGIACRGETPPTLSELGGVEQLQTRFNRDAGKPRIVLLLSPT